MMNKFVKRNKTGGYQLVEMLVAIFILTLVIGLIGAFQANVFSFNRIIQSGLQNQMEAKRLLRPFANEVRSSSQSSLGGYALETTGTSTLVFFADIDSDGSKERIRYSLEGTNFIKGIVEPTGEPLSYDLNNEEIITIIHDVVSSPDIFTYYDSSYDGTASSTALIHPVTPADVRLVKIVITIDSDPNKPPAPVTVTTQVSIRNLKDNL